ncbi:ExeA family protein [Alkalimonas amylolytica]|uniref:General secretion pathway protein A n=1 Tax=Alkalimonas amylolytica TaxID=152573 RepID=A0A1H3XQQ4_ALKAM|nr:AAA family ATPase [Alkalimonas amylolytica]SEA00924.1 general secretion pathway protein A [Alkalimonas amylolytica]
MYTGFFGLHSQPFSIAPNPDFLFLSGRHAEALAHLRYGLGDAGGFVLLTGEVGTGKTTVSRALLQELDENTELAFILNPTLSELELLATVCDELRIRYKKSDASLKLLGDKIKNRLLKNHQSGKQTLLIIDEAQHLQPVVLEQLRLLTNLETNSRKLLQVILIGQPELQQLLQRSDLRQLAQRITARYHLMPLTETEVQQYLSYRLKVAGSERPVFEAAAVRQLYQRSQGIPRLLNLLADRAMLAAFARQKPLVGKAEVQQAAREILPASAGPASALQPGLWLWLLALVPLMAGLGFVLARVLG